MSRSQRIRRDQDPFDYRIEFVAALIVTLLLAFAVSA
jgi:hypothetical protein